jgi:hypothetical protein
MRKAKRAFSACFHHESFLHISLTELTVNMGAQYHLGSFLEQLSRSPCDANLNTLKLHAFTKTYYAWFHHEFFLHISLTELTIKMGIQCHLVSF